MTCWKCGKAIKDSMGSECEACEAGIKPRVNPITGDTMQQPTPPNLHMKGWPLLDASKIKTLDDVKLILHCLQIRIDPNHDDYKKLKHLLVNHTPPQ